MSKNTSIRFSDDEHQFLTESADANGRTLSQEIRYRLFTAAWAQNIDQIEAAQTAADEAQAKELAAARTEVDTKTSHLSEEQFDTEVDAIVRDTRERPAWKASGGLSKKEQAGGRYDR